MAQYRQKGTEVDAVQWTGDNRDAVAEFMGDSGIKIEHLSLENKKYSNITGKHGQLYVEVNGWIIRDARGVFAACAADRFAAQYEAVDASDQHSDA